MLFEVQIVYMLHDHMYDMYELDISDGVPSIIVNLDTELNYLVEENKIDIFDILVVRKAWGHPTRFCADLVSILLLEILYIDIFLNLHWNSSSLSGKTFTKLSVVGEGRVFIGLQCLFQDLIVNLDSAHVTIVFED